MDSGRAKTIMGAAGTNMLEVYGSREIIIDFSGIHGSRAKVIMGFVMVDCSRKIAVSYAEIHSGCSVGHSGSFLYKR